MSKAFKKISKVFSPSRMLGVDKVLGDMGLPNLSGRNAAMEAQQKQAREQANIARQQAQQQQQQAAEAARASAMQMRTDTDRQRIIASQQDQSPVDTSSPTVEDSNTETAAERRRKYRAPQVGGTGGGTGGASIRL